MELFQNFNEVAFDFWAKPVLTDKYGEYYCPGYEGKTYSSNPWDWVQIGGGTTPFLPMKTPGICTVHCHKEYAVDKKKPAGSHGATITIHGIDAADIDIEVMIWTPEQLRQLRILWGIIFPGNKGRQEPRDVSHPVLTQHNVKSMVIVRGSGPERGPVINSRIFTISGLEFANPVKTASVTSKGAQPIGSKLDEPEYPTPGSNPTHKGPT